MRTLTLVAFLAIAEVLVPAAWARDNLIPGGGSGKTDCIHEWLTSPPSALDSHGLPTNRLQCTDDNPVCDFGVTAGDDICTFHVALCPNVAEQRFSCEPSDVARVELKRPRQDRPRDLSAEADRDQLESALEGIGAAVRGQCTNSGVQRGQLCAVQSDCDSTPGSGDGVCQGRFIAFQPPLVTTDTCTEFAAIGVRAGRQKILKLKTTPSNDPASGRRRAGDTDSLRLICERRHLTTATPTPATTGPPPTQTPTATRPTPTRTPSRSPTSCSPPSIAINIGSGGSGITGGEYAHMTANYSGSVTTITWYFDGVAQPGHSSDAYFNSVVCGAHQVQAYVAGACGAAWSNVATLQVFTWYDQVKFSIEDCNSAAVFFSGTAPGNYYVESADVSSGCGNGERDTLVWNNIIGPTHYSQGFGVWGNGNNHSQVTITWKWFLRNRRTAQWSSLGQGDTVFYPPYGQGNLATSSWNGPCW